MDHKHHRARFWWWAKLLCLNLSSFFHDFLSILTAVHLEYYIRFWSTVFVRRCNTAGGLLSCINKEILFISYRCWRYQIANWKQVFTFVECMNIVHTVFACVPWIHDIYFTLRQPQFINYLCVGNLSPYLTHSPRERQQIFQQDFLGND